MPTEDVEVAVRETQAVAPMNVMETIRLIAMDPRVDVAKLESVIALQERVMDRQAKSEFDAAMARLQPKLPRITKYGQIKGKDGGIRSTFAKYEDIDAVIRPLLNDEGFAFSFDTIFDAHGKIMAVKGFLKHIGGHADTRQFPVAHGDSAPGMSGTQAIGSLTSFGKRYLVIMMLNLVTVDQDDDATNQEAAGQLDRITDSQVAQIEDMIQSLSDKDPDALSAFLAYTGVSRVSQLPQFAWRSAMNALYSKQKAQQRGGLS